MSGWVQWVGLGGALWMIFPAGVSGAGDEATGKELLAVNQMLLGSPGLVASSNLVVPTHGVTAESSENEFELRLRFAQHAHRTKELSRAKESYVALLSSEADEKIKQTALLGLALIAQEEEQPARAQQIYSQYIRRYPGDSSVPEILLRQGLLYRRMGASRLAISKFFGVLGNVLTMKEGDFAYHQRLVLQAQAEIADTYADQGRYSDAVDYLTRLLKLDAPELNKAFIRYKLVRARSAMGSHREVVVDARDYLHRYAETEEEAEVRFLLAKSLKALGENREALQELSFLLKDQRNGGRSERWNYWQQRIGNEIANQLYQEGDYVNALSLYSIIATLDDAPTWQLPVWYQIGLAYERLEQPSKAIETYGRIIAREKEGTTVASPSLKTVVEMARWREELLKWQFQTRQATTGGAGEAQASASSSGSNLP